MNWLQKIAQRIEFDQTLDVLQQYVNKLPGQWRVHHANKLDDEEMSISYLGRNVKTHADKYIIQVWFMFDPEQQPSYEQSIGHHSIRFGCLVFKVLHPDDEGERLEDIGFARHELDTPQEVVDYAWGRIENDGWDSEEQEDKPVSPISPEYSSPEISNPKLQLQLV